MLDATHEGLFGQATLLHIVLSAPLRRATFAPTPERAATRWYFLRSSLAQRNAVAQEHRVPIQGPLFDENTIPQCLEHRAVPAQASPHGPPPSTPVRFCYDFIPHT